MKAPQTIRFVKPAAPDRPKAYRATSGSACVYCGKKEQMVADGCKQKMYDEHVSNGGGLHVQGFRCDCEICEKFRAASRILAWWRSRG